MYSVHEMVTCLVGMIMLGDILSVCCSCYLNLLGPMFASSNFKHGMLLAVQSLVLIPVDNAHCFVSSLVPVSIRLGTNRLMLGPWGTDYPILA